MIPQLVPGMPIALTRIADRAPLPQGRLATPHTFVVARGVAGTWTPGPSLLAVGFVNGRRVVAEAEFFLAQGEHDVFRICGDWRWIDSRRHPRYDTRLPAVVRSPLGLTRQAGTLLNLSLGGAAIQVAQGPDGPGCELVLTGRDGSIPLPARIVNTRSVGRGLVLHLEFQPLTSAQEAFLRDVIDELAAGATSGERV